MWSMRVLTAIRVGTAVGRADQPLGLHIPPTQILIIKLLAVDTDPPRAVALVDVAALDHELVDDAVEGCCRVGQAIVLAGAQLAEAAAVSSAWRTAAEGGVGEYFSAVRGHLSAKSSMTSRPTGSSPMLTSRKQRGLLAGGMVSLARGLVSQ